MSQRRKCKTRGDLIRAAQYGHLTRGSDVGGFCLVFFSVLQADDPRVKVASSHILVTCVIKSVYIRCHCLWRVGMEWKFSLGRTLIRLKRVTRGWDATAATEEKLISLSFCCRCFQVFNRVQLLEAYFPSARFGSTGWPAGAIPLPSSNKSAVETRPRFHQLALIDRRRMNELIELN